jgi:hypothetical protein
VSFRRLWPAAALAVAACLAAVFVVAVVHRPAAPAAVLNGPPVAAAAHLTPDEPQFGDAVVATITVAIDTHRTDPRSVGVNASFGPFSVIATTRTAHRTGRLETIQIADRLECLVQACVPLSQVAAFRFPRVKVSYEGGSLAVPWPGLQVHSRLTPADLAQPMLRVDPPVARPRYRLPPAASGWTIIAAAALAALAGLGLVGWALAPSLRSFRRRRPPLELALAELARGGDEERRRTALERLARELEPVNEPLSSESRILAWAREEPAPEAISDLASRVRSTVLP